MYNFVYMDRSPEQAMSTSRPGIPSLLRLMRSWLAERAVVGRVETELHMHTDRELADLGLARADIPAVARGTYQRG